mgnify:CR=1 FL=1|jgi:hypothetical protein
MTTKTTTDFLSSEAKQIMLKFSQAKTPAEQDKYKKILIEIQGRLKSHIKTINLILEQ